jgi:UDP-N-acetylmuramate dehydrogenase
VKIAAGWLVDKAGFKDYEDIKTGMATWKNQSLVLINKSAKNTSALLRFKQQITDTVFSKFGIALEQEPELI